MIVIRSTYLYISSVGRVLEKYETAVLRRRLRWGERPFRCVYLAGQICGACIYKITRDLKDKERAVDRAFVCTGWFARRRRRQTRAQKQSGTTRVTDVATRPKREIIFSGIATRETWVFATISRRGRFTQLV